MNRMRLRTATAKAPANLARIFVLATVILALAVTTLVGQQVPNRLTLDEAIRLARENNPTFQTQKNDQAPADWQVRSAYGAFLPRATASGGMTYIEAGTQRFGTVDLGVASTDWYSSSYSLSLNWQLDGRTLFGVSNARASAAATAARIGAARFNLESLVTLQYMTVLRARDAAAVAQRQLDRARRNVELVGVRVQAQAAAGIDRKQAEVDMGRAEVALIQAQQTLRAEYLRLAEQLGLQVGPEVDLVSEFEVFEPTWETSELLNYALSRHPSLRAFVAQESAGRAAVRQASSQYFPSVSVSTSFRGFSQQALNEDYLINSASTSVANRYENCMAWHGIQDQLGVQFPGVSADCGSPTLSLDQVDEIVAANDVFPFKFQKQPVSLSLGVSIPIFTGFNRQAQLEQAQAQAKDAEHLRRAEELRLRTAVTEGYDLLRSAYEVVRIEERNRSLAGERLELARQRYGLGAADVIELLDAETSMTTAERDYLNAVYQFHQALVSLENATGRTLRPGVDLSEEPDETTR